jgi:CBS-domain-containing membrane protein
MLYDRDRPLAEVRKMAIGLNLNVIMAQWEQAHRGEKLTLRRLSDLTGVNKNTLGRLKSGTAERMDLSTLDTLCRFFNCTPNDLLLFNEEGHGVVPPQRRDVMKDKLVRDVMHRKVISCRVDTPLKDVARRMDAERINALVVVDEGGDLAGVVSQTDLVKVSDQDWEKMVAEDVMTVDVVTIVADIPVLAAVELMVDNQVHRLVITQGGLAPRRPVGVLSMTDVIREMAK